MPSAMPSTADGLNGDIDESTPLLSRARTYKLRGKVARYLLHIYNLIKQILLSSYANILLMFLPIGIISNAMRWSPALVFTFNFLALIPMASLLSFASEELSARFGRTGQVLFGVVFGNAYELIVSFAALRNGELRVLQSSMLGNILFNILLLLGCSFFAGGYGSREQTFNATLAFTMSSMMTVVSISLIVPATLYSILSKTNTSSDFEKGIIQLSRNTAIVLLIIYVIFIYFQLMSHAHLFEDLSGEYQLEELNDSDEVVTYAADGVKLTAWAGATLLVVTTVAVTVCAEYLVSSIDDIAKAANISKTFIGLILLPTIRNTVDLINAIVISVRNRMDMAIGIAIDGSVQTALLVVPLLVILGWIIGQPMTLHFQTFEAITFFLSVLVVNGLIQNGKSTYFEGSMLLGTYFIIANALYIYPNDVADLDALK
ncbi:MAG: hypothetical protein M1813_004165 [Trichoglossum hirsutum]|nr:MAG: hypothetical protein M1813_004165 [Trichoglossum hirsutum]